MHKNCGFILTSWSLVISFFNLTRYSIFCLGFWWPNSFPFSSVRWSTCFLRTSISWKTPLGLQLWIYIYTHLNELKETDPQKGTLCHHLLILILFQIHLTFLLLCSMEERILLSVLATSFPTMDTARLRSFSSALMAMTSIDIIVDINNMSANKI